MGSTVVLSFALSAAVAMGVICLRVSVEIYKEQHPCSLNSYNRDKFDTSLAILFLFIGIGCFIVAILIPFLVFTYG